MCIFPFFHKYGQMKSLFEKTKQTHRAIMQKVNDALQQRDDMKIQMEEAFTAKEAVSTALNSSVVLMHLLWKKIRLKKEIPHCWRKQASSM